MEKVERQSQEESYLWFPSHFLNQTLKAILRCLGLLHHDPPTVTKPSSDLVPLNQPEDEEEEEEEDDVMEENVVVTTRGSRNGFVITSRGTKVKAKTKKKEKVSSGRSGQHH